MLGLILVHKIVLRLKKEICDAAADSGRDDRGDTIDKEIAPLPLRLGIARGDDGTESKAGNKVVVVGHDAHIVPYVSAPAVASKHWKTVADLNGGSRN